MRAHASMAWALSGLFFMGTLTAQDLQTPDRGEQFHVSSIRLRDVPAKPVTVKITTEATSIDKSGRSVTRYSSEIESRDSRGRVYQSFSNWSGSEPSQLINLFDATAGTVTSCADYGVKGKLCYVKGYGSPDRRSPPSCTAVPVPSDMRVNGSNLAEYKLDGVTVTRMLEACIHDGGRSTSSVDFWLNSDLQLELSVYTKLPSGVPFKMPKIESRVIEFNRAEPDPRLFDIPDGFTVIDQRSDSR